MGILESIKCALIAVMNFFIEHVLNNVLGFIELVIELLPEINIFPEPPDLGDFGRSMGYFIPIPDMLLHMAILTGALVVWYSYEYIMRLVKMIK